MTSYKRIIPPLVLIGSAVVASVLAALLVERLRDRGQAPRTKELDDWENEGGTVTATNVAAP